MPSILFNAVSETSSMSCTYPPTTKLSKQSTAIDEHKPITRNLQTSSPLFNKCSSSQASLRLGHHRCHHCQCLHSQEVVEKMVKQKKSMDGGGKDERADWKDPKELEAFCRFCAVQVMDGQRKATGFLSKIGVNEVIRQLGEMGKVVTWVQIKNKWDNLRKMWKTYNKCMDNETGLGYDAGTGMFDAPDEWWNRKIAACLDAKTFKLYGLPNRDLLNIMFGGTVARKIIKYV